MSSFGFLFGSALSLLAVAAAIWIMASGGSDDNALFMLLVSLAILGWTIFIAYAQQKTDHWLAQFPGPVSISAPAWQRVLLCLLLMLPTCLLIYGGVIINVRRSDWEFVDIAVSCIFGLLCAIGALFQLPRRELLLSLDKLEYRSLQGVHLYGWSEFSQFRVFGRGMHLLCEFAHQSSRHPLFRRSLLISGPLGVPKSMLKTLLISWQARALAHAPAQAASRAAASDPVPRKRSLLDYA